jgi:hypothetical protein
MNATFWEITNFKIRSWYFVYHKLVNQEQCKLSCLFK